MNRHLVRRGLAVAIAMISTLGSATEVKVDARYDRRAISPDVYGVVFGGDDQLERMGVTVRRHGGNGFSRYNWKTSTTNTGGDQNTGGDPQFFQMRAQSLGDGGSVSSVDGFVLRNRAAGVRSMIELPLVGSVSAAMNPGAAHCGFQVSRYGPQTMVDPFDADCGNGVSMDGGAVHNDPLAISTPADSQWTRDWVGHLVSTFGTAAAGGVTYYNLGNQPALWHVTHKDVHPAPSTYAELKLKLEQHGQAVKDVDPTALTMGPAAWGWLEYYDSAAADRAITGVDFLPFYLRAAMAYEAAHGLRILDFLDVHVYPQALGVALGGQTPLNNAMRLRSTRILWDPTYVVESWESCCYGGVLNILPRMRSAIATNYPGTRLAISSYAFGAIDTTNGALTEAAVLGIFGREGVDVAALEWPPAPGTIGEDAFKLFRNYDGAGSRFGDTSVRAVSLDPGSLSSFAAYDTTGRLSVMLINTSPLLDDVAVVSFAGVGQVGPWRSFEFGAGGRLHASGSGDVDGGTLTRIVPAYTATLIEFRPTGPMDPPLVDVLDAGAGVLADGGAVDPADAGGSSDGGVVRPGQPSAGCGCGAVGSGWLVLGLLPLLRLARRPRSA